MKVQYMKNLALLGVLYLLVACSGSATILPTNLLTNSGDILSLTLTSPSDYPAGIAANIPIIVTNNGNKAINNLNYSIDNISNTTGGSITIQPTAASNCRVISPKSSCILMTEIAATPISHPGNFNLTVTQAARTNFSVKSLTRSASITIQASIGLIELTDNVAIGADGLTVFSPSRIVGNVDENTKVVITVVVNSANAGSFNTINLVDEAGNLLDYKILSSFGSADTARFSQGSIVFFAVTIPHGSTQLKFKVQTANNGVVSSTETHTNTVLVTNSALKIGILTIYPKHFHVTAENSSQIITLRNSGNGAINNLNLTASAPLSELSNSCGAILAVGDICQYVVKFNRNTSHPAGVSTVTANYNDAFSDQSLIASVKYTIFDQLADLQTDILNGS